MLHNVPQRINSLSRAVVLRHPNSFEGIAYRKRLTRDPEQEKKTIGGMGMLGGEDESEYTWDRLGACKVLKSDGFTLSDMHYNDSTFDNQEVDFTALIECKLEPEESGFFVPESRDVIYLMPGAGVAIAYEVVDTVTTVGISPHTFKYAMHKRDELDYVDF